MILQINIITRFFKALVFTMKLIPFKIHQCHIRDKFVIYS